MPASPRHLVEINTLLGLRGKEAPRCFHHRQIPPKEWLEPQRAGEASLAAAVGRPAGCASASAAWTRAGCAAVGGNRTANHDNGLGSLT